MQQQQKVQNMETSVPKTPQMNERDFVNDMLTLEKYMTSSYNTALDEASNDRLYQELATIYRETQDCQREFFNLMFKNGWYTLEEAPQQKVNQTHQQFSNYASQFPYH